MLLNQEKENNINKSFDNIMKNIKGMVDVNSVVGKPFKTETGEYIIPVSKITVGILSGGGEYGKLSVFNKNSSFPFSAGNGTIVSVKPCGFLVKENDGYKIISVANNSYEKFIDKAGDILSQLTLEQ